VKRRKQYTEVGTLCSKRVQVFCAFSLSSCNLFFSSLIKKSPSLAVYLFDHCQKQGCQNGQKQEYSINAWLDVC
jgi:hypothetical protein